MVAARNGSPYGDDTQGTDMLIAGMLVWSILALLPLAALLCMLVRRRLALREYGTPRVTREAFLALAKKHPLLRVLSLAVTVLALLTAALVVPPGYADQFGDTHLHFDFTSPIGMFN